MPPSNNEPPGEIPLSPRARGTLEGAPRQAMGLKDDVVGTEHLLLALLIERDSRTASVLTLLGCPPDLLRTTVLEERARPRRAKPPAAGLAPALAERAREVAAGPRREHARRRRPDARARRPLRDADARADRARRHPAGAPRRDPASPRRVTRATPRRYLPDAASPSSRAALARARGAPSSSAPGSFGTAVAVLLARGGFRTTLQTRTREQARALEADRENAVYLPGVELPRELRIEPADDGLGARRLRASSASPRAALDERDREPRRAPGSTAARR